MISLLLTLFISLFSVGSPINSIESHQENSIIIYENQNIKRVADYNDVVIFTSTTDIMSKAFLDNLINFSVQNYGVAFRDGTNVAYSVQLQNEPIGLVDFTNINFENPNSTYVNSYLSNLVLDSTRYQKYTVYYVNFNFVDTSYNFYLQYFVFDTLDKSNENTMELTGDLSNCICRLNPSRDYFNYTTRGFMFSTFDVAEDIAYLFLNSGNRSVSYGYTDGYNSGRQAGYEDGRRVGYQEGVTATLNDMQAYDTTALTIFNGIFDVGLLPVNVFLTIFNFELFGVNIAGIISGLLTLSVVIIIIRFLLGGKKDD